VRDSDLPSRHGLPAWIVVLVLTWGCGRESLGPAADAALDRPEPTDQAQAAAVDGSLLDTSDDGDQDGRARDTRARDVPVDASADSPCPSGFGLCAATCVDQRTNQNCGACGRACQAGTTCVDGACSSICPAGTSYCPVGGACVNLASALDNCGQCGHVCGAGQVCLDALCRPACRATLAWDVPQMTLLPNGAAALVMSDLDGDGYRDLVFVRNGMVEVWRNQGDGRFEPLPDGLPTLGNTEQVSRLAVADFDGDGRLDLLLALNSADTTSTIGRFLMFRGTAKSGFVRAAEFPLEKPLSPTGWSVADMDGDGRADLIMVDEQTIVVWLGQADGRQTLASKTETAAKLYYPLLADVSGDGKLDLVAADTANNAVHVFLGLGHGQIAPAVVTTLPEARNPLAVVDGNADGIPELLISKPTGSLLVRVSKDGLLTDPQPLEDDVRLYAAVFFDLDQDGKLDFIRSVADQELRISMGKGDGTFGPPRRYAQGSSTVLNVGDFDRDGRTDVVVQNDVPRGLLMRKGRDGEFPGTRIYPETEVPTADVVWSGKVPQQVDFNEDGYPDTVDISTSATVDVTLGGADAGQSTVKYPASGVSTFLITDVDQDGHLDLAFAIRAQGTVTILLGRGDGSFDQRMTVMVGSMQDNAFGFSAPRPGRGRDLLFQRSKGQIGVLASTGPLCL
jgi:hypothetical protein